MQNTRLLSFLLNQSSTVFAKRSAFYGLIHTWSDLELEIDHNYISWVFPLKEKSEYSNTPVLTDDCVKGLRMNSIFQTRLCKMADRMLQFYATNDHWLVPVDHNHLRITRIIRCLKLLSPGTSHAKRFYHGIMFLVTEKNAEINDKSLEYWYNAAYMYKPEHAGLTSPLV